jgi:hypothetical protein
MEHRVNLALLIQHFHPQRSANTGDIHWSGLVTQIAYFHGLTMPPSNLIMGSKYFDNNHMASTKFLGVYKENTQLHAYHF